MSIIKVDTNVPASGINEAFCEQITESLAKTFKKSKSDILVFVNSDQPIINASSQEPAAIVSVLSVDGINEVDNKHHSAAMFPLIAKYLKINDDRITITFTAVEKAFMGRNGKTFIQ